MMKESQARFATLHDHASDWLQVIVSKTFPMADFKAAYTEVKERLINSFGFAEMAV
jgi:disulfide oxidoreductase YuzD